MRKLSQVFYALFTGNGLSRTLAGASVGTGTLTTHWQALFVPDAPIALDFSQSMDALSDLAAQWAFHRVIAFEQGGKTAQFIFIQVSSLFRRIDLGLYARFPGDDRANTVQILKRINDLLVIRNVNTEKTRHTLPTPKPLSAWTLR